MKRKIPFISGAVTLGALLGGCGSSSPAPPPPSPPMTGIIQGTLSISPPFGHDRPTDGHVKATAASGASFSTSVASDGRFVLRVPAGSYALLGSSPLYLSGGYHCISPARVSISRGQTSQANVVCEEK